MKYTAKKEHFNEATRVQIPALIHLDRLGYEYIGKVSEHNGINYDHETNILTDIFINQFNILNSPPLIPRMAL
ncbi:hypothetical protein [Brachyspira sp.]|uniref:hypothetical protein n=1 Tax=Brachyspira sp. TaxID=1977261 RepID=UPI002615A9C0|nr:hypothetical protein [Brachyspira sp.]